MSRKRLTQVFPFLLPIRKWQRKKFFYYKMQRDGRQYAKRIAGRSLLYMVFEGWNIFLLAACKMGGSVILGLPYC